MPHLSWNLKVLTLDIKFLFYIMVFIFLDVFVLNSIGNYFLNERGSLFALESEEVYNSFLIQKTTFFYATRFTSKKVTKPLKLSKHWIISGAISS